MWRKIAVPAIAVAAACSDATPAARESQPVAAAPDSVARATPDPRKVILFVGTSLTAGYGLGAAFAYPAVIQQKLDSAGLSFRVVNAGISGETSAGALRRIDWVLQLPVEVLVLELGANDGLRGLDPDSMYKNLDAIIRQTKRKYPSARILLAGMEAPPNLGGRYGARFRSAFRDLAEEHNVGLIPFILEGVGGRPELNQDDGIHPTIAGQRLMANTVWTYLQPLLQKSD
jgi:acyl-CoA thioesterase-1